MEKAEKPYLSPQNLWFPGYLPAYAPDRTMPVLPFSQNRRCFPFQAKKELAYCQLFSFGVIDSVSAQGLRLPGT